MNRLIATYFQKKYEPILVSVFRRFENYAKKCNAVFEAYEIPEESLDPQLDKFFHVADSLPDYDEYLIIDVDILVRHDSPCIFDIVGKRVGLYNEGGTFLNAYGHNTDDELVRWVSVAQMIKLCNLDPIAMPKRGEWGTPFFYFNSGVVVFSAKHRDIYSGFSPSARSLINKHSKEVQCSEQALVNYSVYKLGYPVVSLPTCFNQMCYNRCSDYLDTSYFLHFAGMSLEDKLVKMKEEDTKWGNWGY